MAKRKDVTLTEEELKVLNQALKRDKRSGLSRRATAVRVLHLGHKPLAVAEMVAASVPSVYSWHERFREAGVDGLANKEKQPRGRKVTPAYLEALEEAVEQEPFAYGYDFAIWTRERLCDHLAQQTGVRIGPNWLGVLMRREGYVFRRPKHDLSQARMKQPRRRPKPCWRS